MGECLKHVDVQCGLRWMLVRFVSHRKPRMRVRAPKIALSTALLLVGILSMGTGGPRVLADSTDTEFRVVELFTSHGCSSCPPADMLLGQLIRDNPALVALEFHVDYWDDLVFRGSNWVDPFSDSQWTERQRGYARAGLKGRGGVYTPQIVVNGRYAAVGSDVRRVNKALAKAHSASAHVTARRVGDKLSFSVQAIDAYAEDAGIYLARFRKRAMTDITAGENRHLMLKNYNIVESIEQLGVVAGEAAQDFEVPVAADGHGCALFVRAEPSGPMLGAINCP